MILRRKKIREERGDRGKVNGRKGGRVTEATRRHSVRQVRRQAKEGALWGKRCSWPLCAHDCQEPGHPSGKGGEGGHSGHSRNINCR